MVVDGAIRAESLWNRHPCEGMKAKLWDLGRGRSGRGG